MRKLFRAGFYVWCSPCKDAISIADHKTYCLKGVGRTSWWPWTYGIECECPHNEDGFTASRLLAFFNKQEGSP